MKNFICTGERITVVAPAGGLVAGQPYVVGTKLVIIVSGGIEGENVSAMTEGVFAIDKAVGAISQGDKLYWDNVAKNMTKTVAGNTFAGYAYEDSLAADAVCFVTIVDNAGDVQAIPVAALVAAIATADGSDAATTQALANQLKTTVNGILTALKAAGLMANA